MRLFSHATASPAIYTLSLHDALPISRAAAFSPPLAAASDCLRASSACFSRSEEHTSELQSRGHLVCRLLLEKKKGNSILRIRFEVIRYLPRMRASHCWKVATRSFRTI